MMKAIKMKNIEKHDVMNNDTQQNNEKSSSPSYRLAKEKSSVTLQPGPNQKPLYILTREYNKSVPETSDIPLQPSSHNLTKENNKSIPKPLDIPTKSPLYVLTEEYKNPAQRSVDVAKQSPVYALTEAHQNSSSQPCKWSSTLAVGEECPKQKHPSMLAYSLPSTKLDQSPFNPHSKSVESPKNKHFNFTVLDSAYQEKPSPYKQPPASYEEYIRCYEQQTSMLQQYERLYREQYNALQAYQHSVQNFQQSQTPPKDVPQTGIFYDVANKTQITVSASPKSDVLTSNESQTESKTVEKPGFSPRDISGSPLICYDVHITITPNVQPHVPDESKNELITENYSSKMPSFPTVCDSGSLTIPGSCLSSNIQHDMNKSLHPGKTKLLQVKFGKSSVRQNQPSSVEIEREEDDHLAPLSMAEIKRNSLRNRRRTSN